MKRLIATALLLTMVVSMVACTSSYDVVVPKPVVTPEPVVAARPSVQAANVTTPLTLEEATEVTEVVDDSITVITFVLTDGGLSVDRIVNFWNFYPGAQGDVMYMVRNESSMAIKPSIGFVKDTRVEDYSAVEGQPFFDPPNYIEKWITITPAPYLMPPYTAQGYMVNFAMPVEAVGFPNKFAFQVAVTHGGSLKMSVSTWWLIRMR